MWFVNYSGWKYSPDFQNTGMLEVFYKSSRSILINAVIKHLNFRSSASKLESIKCKFIKSSTPSSVFFEEFHCKCRTAILKNASRWLLLGSTFFWKYSSMAAFQRQLQRCIYFRNSRLHMFYMPYSDVMLKRNEFAEGFDEKCQHTEVALNFIQKQYFS